MPKKITICQDGKDLEINLNRKSPFIHDECYYKLTICNIYYYYQKDIVKSNGECKKYHCSDFIYDSEVLGSKQ